MSEDEPEEAREAWEARISINNDPGWPAPTCFTCRFWCRNYANVTEPNNAECHRNAPKPTIGRLVTGEDIATGNPAEQWTGYCPTVWPLTRAQDWCAEHEPLAKPPA